MGGSPPSPPPPICCSDSCTGYHYCGSWTGCCDSGTNKWRWMSENCAHAKYKKGQHMWYDNTHCAWGCCKSNGTDAGWRKYCSGIPKGHAYKGTCDWGCCKKNGTDAGWREYCSGIPKGHAFKGTCGYGCCKKNGDDADWRKFCGTGIEKGDEYTTKCFWGCCKRDGTDADWRKFCATGFEKGDTVVEIYPKIRGKYCRNYDWSDTGYGYCSGGMATRIYDGEDNPGNTAETRTMFCAEGCYKRNVEKTGGKDWEEWGKPVLEKNTGAPDKSMSPSECQEYANQKAEWTYDSGVWQTQAPKGCWIHGNNVRYNTANNNVNCGVNYGGTKVTCLEKNTGGIKLTHFAMKPSGRCICYGSTCNMRNSGGWDLYKYEYSDKIARAGYA